MKSSSPGIVEPVFITDRTGNGTRMEEPPAGRTQDEIMAIALFKLGLKPSDTLADLGCGRGTVGLAASQHVDHVYAVDDNPDAVGYAREAAQRAGAQNITFFRMSALDFLGMPKKIDAAFVGGSRTLPKVIGALAERKVRKVVVSAVLHRTVTEGVSAMKEQGIFGEVLLVQVSRSRPLAGDWRFEPVNPVFLIIGGADPC